MRSTGNVIIGNGRGVGVWMLKGRLRMVMKSGAWSWRGSTYLCMWPSLVVWYGRAEWDRGIPAPQQAIQHGKATSSPRSTRFGMQREKSIPGFYLKSCGKKKVIIPFFCILPLPSSYALSCSLLLSLSHLPSTGVDLFSLSLSLLEIGDDSSKVIYGYF